MFLYAFDLIELSGEDRRREPLEKRKADLERVYPTLGRPASFSQGDRGGRARRRDRVRAGLPAGPRRHRLEAEGLALSLRTLTVLAQDEEPSERGGAAGGGRGLGTLIDGKEPGVASFKVPAFQCSMPSHGS